MAAGTSKPNSKSSVLTPGELEEFINETIKNPKPYKRVIIGKLSNEAKKRIKANSKGIVDGGKLININIDSESVYYANSKFHHNLEPRDLLLAVEVINTATDIQLSDTKHQDNNVLIFRKDIDGEITFLTEARVKKGYLLVFDAWRQKKAHSRKRSDAAKNAPESYVQDELTHEQALSKM